MRSLILVVFFFSNLLMAQKEEKILFIGNSFTFYWNLPSQVEQMARQQETKWEVFQSTAGGATLRDHWQGNKGLKTKNLYQKINLIELFFKTIVLIQLNIKILRPFIFLN